MVSIKHCWIHLTKKKNLELLVINSSQCLRSTILSVASQNEPLEWTSHQLAWKGYSGYYCHGSFSVKSGIQPKRSFQTGAHQTLWKACEVSLHNSSAWRAQYPSQNTWLSQAAKCTWNGEEPQESDVRKCHERAKIWWPGLVIYPKLPTWRYLRISLRFQFFETRYIPVSLVSRMSIIARYWAEI